MGRYLAVLIYRLLTQGEAWVDRGVTRFDRRGTEQEPASLNFKARAKGFKLILDHRSQLNENHGRPTSSESVRQASGRGVLNPGQMSSLHPDKFTKKQNQRGRFPCQRVEVSGERGELTSEVGLAVITGRPSLIAQPA